MAKEMKVDLDDLVTLSQYAEEIGYTRQAITNWEHRDRSFQKFPTPLFTVGKTKHNRKGRRGGAKIYSRKVLDAWLTNSGRNFDYADDDYADVPDEQPE
jgi:hypothetical protein